MTPWYLFEFPNDAERVRKLYKKASEAIEQEDNFISEENYYAESEKLPKSVSLMPYEIAIEDFGINYNAFKYNLLSMTIIQLYSLWDQQREKYNGDTFIHKDNSEKLEELRLLQNALKHGKGTSEKKLRKLYPKYFCKNEINESIIYLQLNFDESDLDDFTDEIISIWKNELKRLGY